MHDHTNALVRPSLYTMQHEPVAVSIEMLHSQTLPRLVKVGDLVLDMLRQTVHKGNKRLLMPQQLFQLLLYLAIRSTESESIHRDEIGEWVYGRAQCRSDAIHMVIYRLRNELAAVKSGIIIKSDYREGYRLYTTVAA